VKPGVILLAKTFFIKPKTWMILKASTVIHSVKCVYMSHLECMHAISFVGITLLQRNIAIKFYIYNKEQYSYQLIIVLILGYFSAEFSSIKPAWRILVILKTLISCFRCI